MMKVPVFHVNGEDPGGGHPGRRASRSSSGSASAKTSSSTCSATASTATTRATSRASRSRVMYAAHRPEADGPRGLRQEARRERADHAASRRDELKATRKAALDAGARGGAEGRLPASRRRAMDGVWTPYIGGPDKRVAGGRHERAARATLVDAAATRLADAARRLQREPEGARRRSSRAASASRASAALRLGHAASTSRSRRSSREGRRVRLTGQDARRGTFTPPPRDALRRRRTGARYTPLAHARAEPGAASRSTTARSPRPACSASSTATASTGPTALVIWEAQFGDFANGAQVIIDQFIVVGRGQVAPPLGPRAAPAARLRGPGPGALERAPRALPPARRRRTTSRSATSRRRRSSSTCCGARCCGRWRKPLVIFTPKSLLRHKEAVSTIDDLANGRVPARDPRRGRPIRANGEARAPLHAARSTTTSLDARRKLGRDDVAIVRLEQLYPLNDELPDGARAVRGRHAARLGPGRAAQHGRLVLHEREPSRRTSATRLPLSRRLARRQRASPATGSKASHDLEQKMLIEAALG